MKIHFLSCLLAFGVGSGIAAAEEQQTEPNTGTEGRSGLEESSGAVERPGVERPDSATTQMTKDSQEENKVDNQADVSGIAEKNIATISFENGKSDLSANNTSTLKSTVNAVQQDGQIQRAVVAAWSDRQGSQGESLGESDKNLAEQRADAIEKQLKDAGIQDVQKHAMTEAEPTWVESTFASVQSPMDTTTTAETGSDQTVNQVRQLLQEKGGPGKALIILQSEQAPAVAE